VSDDLRQRVDSMSDKRQTNGILQLWSAMGDSMSITMMQVTQFEFNALVSALASTDYNYKHNR